MKPKEQRQEHTCIQAWATSRKLHQPEEKGDARERKTLAKVGSLSTPGSAYGAFVLLDGWRFWTQHLVISITL